MSDTAMTPETNILKLRSTDQSVIDPQLSKLPFNLDAEQALLGAMLFDNDVYYRIADGLQSSHFYDPVHGLIYQTAVKIIESGMSATPHTMATYLESNPGFMELGGSKYLTDLAMNVPSTAGAHDYATVIIDTAVSRGLITISDELSAQAREMDLDQKPDSLIEWAEAQLFELAEGNNGPNGFVSFDQSVTETMSIINAAFEREGGLSGLSTGFKSLDDKLGGLHNSDLIILAGRPSMGKTALATNIAVQVAETYLKHQGIKAEDYNPAVHGGAVGFFSLEMSRQQLTQRILAEKSGVPSDKLRKGTFEQQDYDKIYDATKLLEQLPLHIDHTGAISIAQLGARARRLKRQFGLNLIIVDYLQLMTSATRRENRVGEISEITMGLKALAKELDIPIIALSQLSRALENRSDKRPQLSDLRESGSIEQDADVVMFVYREEYYLERAEPQTGTSEHLEWQEKMNNAARKADVILGKQRHGPVGTTPLGFDGRLTAFSDLGKHQVEGSDRDGF